MRRISLASLAAAALVILATASSASAQATPTLTTQATPFAFVGQPVTDTATLSGGVNPTGTITFRLYGPEEQFPNCTNIQFGSPPATVSGNGTYSSPSQVALSNPGTYRWIATYSGDVNNTSVAGACGDPNETTVVSNAPVTPPVLPPPLVAPTATCKGQQATIVGTSGNDEITGTPERDVIAALGGKDNVSGLAGKDLICGGPGRDTLRGGKGKDKLLGQKGADKLKGGGGNDTCKGGKGRDIEKSC